MLGFSWPELMIVSGSVLFLRFAVYKLIKACEVKAIFHDPLIDDLFETVLLSSELLKWSHIFTRYSQVDYCQSPVFSFGYAVHNGPHTWKSSYPESTGYNQSPINVSKELAVTVDEYDDIEWSGYNTVPSSMIMANDGNSVIVCGTWCDGTRPTIEGGPLTDTYTFHSMRFHWGPSDTDGSEHTIDHVRYAMELQLIHVKRDYISPLHAILLSAKESLVIVTSFFEIMPVDNPYLDYIVTNLRYIARPGTKIDIPPFPLSWMNHFDDKGYYAYNGSLTQPPCGEIVTWLVNPVPAAISSNQVAQFRKLYSMDGLLLTNCRPVQYLNEREVYLYA